MNNIVREARAAVVGIQATPEAHRKIERLVPVEKESPTSADTPAV